MCKVEWCDTESVYSSEYCNRHYIQMQRYGEIHKTFTDKPDIISHHDWSEVKFHNGLTVKIDNADVDEIIKYSWNASGHVKRRYAIRHTVVTKGESGMHRFLMNPPLGMVVDHINGDTLDNRRHNLRVCTQQQNLFNSKINGCGGVYYEKRNKYRKWVASMYMNRKRIYIGAFHTEEEARAAHKKKKNELYGDYSPYSKRREDACSK